MGQHKFLGINPFLEVGQAVCNVPHTLGGVVVVTQHASGFVITENNHWKLVFGTVIGIGYLHLSFGCVLPILRICHLKLSFAFVICICHSDLSLAFYVWQCNLVPSLISVL